MASSSADATDNSALIEQAVRFLQNPKVVPAPEQSKRDFLKSKGMSDEDIDTAMQRAAEQVKPNVAPAPKYEQHTNSDEMQETHTVTFSNTVLSIHTATCTEYMNTGATIMNTVNAALDRCGQDSVIEIQIFYPADPKFVGEATKNTQLGLNRTLQQRYGTSAPIHTMFAVACCAEVTVRVLSVKR